MRIRRRVGEIDRLGGLRHQADQALAFAQARIVDGGAVEAFGGEQLQHLAGAAQIDGADFRHHVGGDDGDQLVQAHLGGLVCSAMISRRRRRSKRVRRAHQHLA